MSSAAEEAEEKTEEECHFCCANCGIAGVDDIKLEECTDLVKYCQSLRYCGDKCREEQRDKHERKLFSQPDETHLGECPICFLPMSLDPLKSVFYECCSETVCRGCVYANLLFKGNHDCPFCREPGASGEEYKKRLMKRIKANDPAALRQMGGICYNKGDYDGAFDYLAKAAELGDIGTHAKLGCMYKKGKGVEKDVEKSMKVLWKHYSAGNITKEKLEATLRSHQAAIDETKSEQRAEAEEFDRRRSQSKR